MLIWFHKPCSTGHVCELCSPTLTLFHLGTCDFAWHCLNYKPLLLSGYRLGSPVEDSFSKRICHSVVSSWTWGVWSQLSIVLSIWNCMGQGNLRESRGCRDFLLLLFRPMKSPPLHVPPGGGWSLPDKLLWVGWLGRLETQRIWAKSQKLGLWITTQMFSEQRSQREPYIKVPLFLWFSWIICLRRTPQVHPNSTFVAQLFI